MHRVGFATVAAGDVMVIGGQRRRVAAIVQTSSGFVLQFSDTTTVHIVLPAESCEIDGRKVLLVDIPPAACFWCDTVRRLVAVGRYRTQADVPHTVYGCTSCVIARGLLPLAGRKGPDAEVRYKAARPQPPASRKDSA